MGESCNLFADAWLVGYHVVLLHRATDLNLHWPSTVRSSLCSEAMTAKGGEWMRLETSTREWTEFGDKVRVGHSMVQTRGWAE